MPDDEEVCKAGQQTGLENHASLDLPTVFGT